MLRRSLFLLTALLAARSAAGTIESFTDFAQWQSAAGSFTTVPFTGFPKFTIITDQYEPLGITFTDGNDFINHSRTSFPQDGAGLSGNFGSPINFAFQSPKSSIAVHYPGDVRFELFLSGIPVADVEFTVGLGGFGGLTSTSPFDTVVISDPFDPSVNIDNLYFGPPIPAPGALGVLVAGLLLRRRRRRRR